MNVLFKNTILEIFITRQAVWVVVDMKYPVVDYKKLQSIIKKINIGGFLYWKDNCNSVYSA